MKILFLSDNFYPEKNAAASRVFERARYWVDWGHEVQVICSAPNFPEGEVYEGYRNAWRTDEIIDGIQVTRVKTFMAPNQGFFKRLLDFWSFMATSFFTGFREAKKADLICASSPQFFTAVSAWAICRIRKKPFYFEVADLWPESIRAVGAVKKMNWLLDIFEKLELKLYRDAEAVIVLTDAFKKNLIQRGIRENKVHVVINGVELSQFQPDQASLVLQESNRWKGQTLVGYIGTHGMAHDLLNALKAAKILETHRSIHFLFMGPGAERKKLIRWAEKEKLKNVTFIESKPKEEVAGVWGVLDLALVHLKNSDTFKTVIPSKIFEAMAMGKPIVLVSPKGEAQALVEKTGSGWHCEAGNPEKLAELLSDLLSQPDLIKEKSARARLASHFYSREKQARAYIEVLEQRNSGPYFKAKSNQLEF